MLLLDVDSPYQRIRLARDPEGGLCLYLDDTRQFVEYHESRYHESLGVVPFLFFRPRRVFVGGGGDGLVAQRILKFPCVQELVLCDYDPMMTRIAREEPDLVALNGGSLLDPRTRVVNADAFGWLEQTPKRFDLILCDFPDPLVEEVGRLYSREFYEIARKRLSERGMLITQTCMTQGSAAIIRNTVRSVFPHEYFFRTHLVGLGVAGFTIGSNRPLGLPSRVPAWTTYLSDAVAQSLFALPKDESYETAIVNSLGNGALVKQTVLRSSMPRMGYPHPYDEETFVLVLDRRTCTNVARERALLKWADEEGPLVVYVERDLNGDFAPCLEALGYARRATVRRMEYRHTEANRSRLTRLWSKLDDDSVAALEIDTFAPCRRDGVRRLLQRYMKEQGDRHVPPLRREVLFARPGLYAVTRSPRGRPIVATKLSFDDGAEVELTTVGGDRPEEVLSMLLLLQHLGREWGGASFVVPPGALARLLGRLGASTVAVYGIYGKAC